MAIQFRCPGCSQPIEVDDVHAGQKAACPYCRRVVSVPDESTLGQGPLEVGRPLAGDVKADAGTPEAPAASRFETPAPPPSPPPLGQLHVGPARSPRQQVASRYGTYGLICTALVLLLFAGTAVYYVGLVLGEMGGDLTSQPSSEQWVEIQTAAATKLAADPRVKAIRVGTAFFAIVGLVCGIVSVTQHRQNWKGIVSLVLCGLFALCTCGDLVSILWETAAAVVLFAHQ
jgi:hypothetical protein